MTGCVGHGAGGTAVQAECKELSNDLPFVVHRRYEETQGFLDVICGSSPMFIGRSQAIKDDQSWHSPVARARNWSHQR